METTTPVQPGISGIFHPQFITDTAGAKLVVRPQQEFESMLEDIETWEDNFLLAKAKSADTGERISMEDVFNMIEAARKEV